MTQSKGLQSNYQHYDRQKCFVAHSLGAEWNEDLKSACASILPKFNLEPWYAADHFDPTQPLRDKVVELIANSRYGIYDISSWQDKQGNWHLPRNVFIELGIAIALNRPTLLLRHSSNKNLPLPVCLQGIETVEFAGDFTLKKELEKRLPQWLDVLPDRDWLNRFCIFGDRVCSFREQHPCSQQWGQKTIHCHIADGLDKQHPNYCQSECDEIRGAFEEIFSRYSDLEFSYLDERSIIDGYQFLLCSHCQTVRLTPFAIYRISPTTSAETFVVIGISIALEKLFAYKLPRIFLVRQEQDLPSLLRGYEVVEAIGTKEVTQKLRASLPKIMGVVRKTSWQPRPLPFIEITEPTQSPSKSGLALEVMLVSVTEKAQKLTDADRGTLWLVDRDRDQLWTKIFGTLQEIRIPIGAGFAGQVTVTGEPVIIPFDLYDDPNTQTSKETDNKTGYRTCSILCMPVFNADGEIIGVTQLINKKKQGDYPPYDPANYPEAPECWRTSFSRTDRDLIKEFNTQIGEALHDPKLLERLIKPTFRRLALQKWILSRHSNR